MGFNKRYVDRERVEDIIYKLGYPELVKYIKSPSVDSLIITDEVSRKVIDIIDSDIEEHNKLMKIIEILKTE